MSEIKKVHSTDLGDQYEVNSSYGILHMKETKEIVLINFDDGEEFLMAEDYEEAVKICEFILSLVREDEIPYSGYSSLEQLLKDYSLRDIQITALGILPTTQKEIDLIAYKLKTLSHNLSGISWNDYEIQPANPSQP